METIVNQNKEEKKNFIINKKILLIKAYVLLKRKQRLHKEMNKTASLFNDIDKKITLKVKDYIYYRGNGWKSKDNPIDKLEEKVKFPDRVSPVFRRLREIVYNLKMTNKLDLLDIYIEAMKEYGIKIEIDGMNEFGLNSVDFSSEKLKNTLDVMCDYQADICGIANTLKDEISINAEGIDLCRKNSFKEFLTYFEGKVEKKPSINKKEQEINERCSKDIFSLSEINKISLNVKKEELTE